MTFELLAFTANSVVVVAVLAGVIFLVGFFFNLNFGAAIAIATYTFVVLLPGGMNCAAEPLPPDATMLRRLRLSRSKTRSL